jgi:homogentisate 1,2-dioxygenase
MADEVAVMIDARHALTPGPDAPTVEVPGYVESWRAGTPTSTA